MWIWSLGLSSSAFQTREMKVYHLEQKQMLGRRLMEWIVALYWPLSMSPSSMIFSVIFCCSSKFNSFCVRFFRTLRMSVSLMNWNDIDVWTICPLKRWLTISNIDTYAITIPVVNFEGIKYLQISRCVLGKNRQAIEKLREQEAS